MEESYIVFATEEEFTNYTNTTIIPVTSNEFEKIIKTICDYITIITLCVIMFAMGTDIAFKQIWDHLRRPVGIVIGMFCQFFVMPLVGFILLKTLNVNDAHTLGVLIVSCCPGGAVSNAFAYFLNGDLSLSVAMTSISTLLALGFMPLNLWMYGKGVDTGKLVIPFANMAKSLAYVTSPAVLGMILKWKLPKLARYVTKIGGVGGFLLIVVVYVLENVAYPGILTNIPWKLTLAVIIMPIVGLTIGYLLAWVCRRNSSVRKTIAIESGVQNVAIAAGIISLSHFSFEVQRSLFVFPMLYGISMITLCFMVCSLYHIHLRFFKKSEKSEPDKQKNGLALSNTDESQKNNQQVFTISIK